ncbi:hypothetical protein [Actinomadura oligospora]|uniref:hypothetical protein n=1 Tax=Actinomadura oligospora TaxID=111804 RepID=UPI00047C83EC|nr:hypothetical protein [Actinomadura oligospora]
MPEDVTTKARAEALYSDLVRLAYLVLPGTEKRVYRLALARRIVDGVLSGRMGLGVPPGAADGEVAQAQLRARVLRRAARPSGLLRFGLNPWLKALPGRLPDPALTAALARLEMPVRVACVLRAVDGMPRYQVRDALVGLGVKDPWAAMEAAEEVRLPVPATPFEPASPRPVRRRSKAPIVGASVLTAGLLGALVVTENGAALGEHGTRGLRLVSAAPDAWTKGRRTLETWPARGDLTTDRALTRGALSAWAALRTGTVRGGSAQLLYAGHLDGRTVAVLRNGERVARYSGPGRPLEVTATGTDPSAPVALGGGRYLLAPWDTEAAVPGGDAVQVRNGVTEPLAPRTHCGRGPVLDLTGPDGSRTIGDLGGARPVVLTYRTDASSAAERTSTSTRHRAGQVAMPGQLSGTGLKLWDRLGCVLPQPARPVDRADAADFWSGSVPHGGGSADWVCTRLDFAGGGSAGQAALVGHAADSTLSAGAGGCDERRPVSGLWWRADSGHWYYLAAAGRGFTPEVEGPLRHVNVRGRLLVASPRGDADHRPDTPVDLTVRDT